MVTSRHHFALYIPSIELSLSHDAQYITIHDENLYSRVTRILRLQAGDMLTLFDAQEAVTINLKSYAASSKQTILGAVIARHKHEPLQPTIVLLQGMTKKPAFEAMLYAAAQMGVRSIVPLKTEKTHSVSISSHDIQRWQRIMIAACEQSKQFVQPVLEPVLSLRQQALASQLQASASRILFDGEGMRMSDWLAQHQKREVKDICVAIGPEGGFSEVELALLNEASFQSVSLGRSVLRSEDAALVALGCLRSLLER